MRGNMNVNFAHNIRGGGVQKFGRNFFVVFRNLLSLPYLCVVIVIAGNF